MDTIQIKRVLEAALLSAAEPLAMPDLRRLFDNELDAGLITKLLDELATDFSDRAVELVRVSSGWRFQTRPDLATYLDRLTPEKAPRYSRAVMETLAIIAYRQPVTRGDIEEIRGVSVSSQIVRTLEERGWIDVIGHKEVIGKPALLGTTDQFLDDIGLQSLKELPPIDDLGQSDETIEMFGKNLVEVSPPDQIESAESQSSSETETETESAQAGVPDDSSQPGEVSGNESQVASEQLPAAEMPTMADTNEPAAADDADLTGGDDDSDSSPADPRAIVDS